MLFLNDGCSGAEMTEKYIILKAKFKMQWVGGTDFLSFNLQARISLLVRIKQ